MSLQFRSGFAIGFICFNIASYAGTVGDKPLFSGLWGGVGGSYISTSTNGNTNITMLQSLPSVSRYLLQNDLGNRFVPVANIGYFSDLPNDWLLGGKVVYKYINVEQYDQSWAGSFVSGTYQSVGLHTKLNQTALFLMTGGYQFGNWLIYGGAGPSIIDVSLQLNGDIQAPSGYTLQPVNVSKEKTVWGGGGQIGFEYMLPNRFMIDISYNFNVSGNSQLSPVYFSLANSADKTLFDQHAQITEQGISLTLNKYFM